VPEGKHGVVDTLAAMLRAHFLFDGIHPFHEVVTTAESQQHVTWNRREPIVLINKNKIDSCENINGTNAEESIPQVIIACQEKYLREPSVTPVGYFTGAKSLFCMA
jgi:hypothetical protein